MAQTFYIPIGEGSTLCQCDEFHYWVVGENEYQCECGRTYRKALDFAFSSSHIRIEVDGDQIIIIDDYEL